MINITEYSGLSIISTPVKVVTSFSGLSIAAAPVKVITSNSGVSLLSLNNLFVCLVDSVTSLPVIGSIEIVNITDLLDVYTNYNEGDLYDEHSYLVNNVSDIAITVTASGYDTQVIILSNVDPSVITKEIVQLVEAVIVIPSFNCDTIFKNVNGNVIAENLVPSNGSIEVVFTGTVDFDYTDYLFFPEGVRVDGIKYSPIDLNYTLKSFTNNSVTFIIENTGERICFISNFIKKC